jgi:hypothetical protein
MSYLHPSVGRHKIRTPPHCTEKLCNCKLSRLEAKTDYFKWFMKEIRNQKNKNHFSILMMLNC